MAYVLDTFTRADSAVTLGSAESQTAQAWSALTGTWGIASNQAYNTSAGASVTAVVESEFNDIDAQVTITPGVGGTIPGLVFRALDDSNRLGLFLNVASGALALFKADAGAATLLDSTTVTLANGTPYVVRVTAVGALISMYLDGVLIDTYTLAGGDATKYTGVGYTKVGLRGSGENRWDNLTARHSVYPTIVQEADGIVAVAGTSGTVTFPRSASADNALVWWAAGDKNTGTVTLADDTTDPDPWTTEHSLPSTSVSLYGAWRVAEGGEDVITATFTAGAAAGSTMWAAEITQPGTDPWTALGKASTITTEAAVSTSSTGTTAALAAAGRAFAAMACDTSNNVTGGTWSDSYTNEYDAPQNGGAIGNSGAGSLHVGSRNVDSGATTGPTWTNAVGSTADQQSAAVLVLGRVAAAPGGGSVARTRAMLGLL